VLVALPVAVLRARQAGPAPLTGTIYDVTGGVIPGVEVALVDANQNRWAATTRATGRFELPPVGPGSYVLEVMLPGVRARRQEFDDAGAVKRRVAASSRGWQRPPAAEGVGRSVAVEVVMTVSVRFDLE
jgi:hypothetical protein